MKNKTVFTPADICLPKISADNRAAWTKWAVIACDQFTSDPAYWQSANALREGAPSARAVRCRLKCHNERNPFRQLPSLRVGTLATLPP